MQEISIADIFEFVRNGASIKQSKDAYGIPITRIETIWNSTVDINRFGYGNITDIELHKNHFLKDGDILMSHINSPKHLGKCALYQGVPEVLIHGMNLLGLRPIKEISHPNYLYFYLSSNRFRQQIKKISNQSVNQASFSAGNLKKLKIPLPSLAEQQKIAAILDTADQLRQKDQQLIDHYTTLSQSLFLEMFGDPVVNPMGWDEFKLKTLFATSPRIGTTTPATDDGITKVVRVGEIGQKQINFSKCKRVKLTETERERYSLHIGDIVLARAIGSINHLGKASLFEDYKELIVFDSHVMRLRFDCKLILSEFFYHWMQSAGGRAIFLKNSGQTAVQFNINAKQISGIKLKLPPIKLQNQFAQYIDKIEQQKQLAQASLEKSETLFNSLLQRAFKGELTQ